jgi:hypothetical protein
MNVVGEGLALTVNVVPLILPVNEPILLNVNGITLPVVYPEFTAIGAALAAWDGSKVAVDDAERFEL